MEHGNRCLFEILVFVFTFDTSKRGGKGAALERVKEWNQTSADGDGLS